MLLKQGWFGMVWFNSLSSHKTLDWTKLKAVADEIYNGAYINSFTFDVVGNMFGKKRKCCFPAFSPFPTISFKSLIPGVFKVLIVE